jgi:hypothetical protein
VWCDDMAYDGHIHDTICLYYIYIYTQLAKLDSTKVGLVENKSFHKVCKLLVKSRSREN